MAQTQNNWYISVCRFAFAHLGPPYNLPNNIPTGTRHCHHIKKRYILVFPLTIPCYQFMTEQQGEKDNIGVRKMGMTDKTKRKKKRRMKVAILV